MNGFGQKAMIYFNHNGHYGRIGAGGYVEWGGMGFRIGSSKGALRRQIRKAINATGRDDGITVGGDLRRPAERNARAMSIHTSLLNSAARYREYAAIKRGLFYGDALEHHADGKAARKAWINGAKQMLVEAAASRVVRQIRWRLPR